jgi:hypothetical protein
LIYFYLRKKQLFKSKKILKIINMDKKVNLIIAAYKK